MLLGNVRAIRTWLVATVFGASQLAAAPVAPAAAQWVTGYYTGWYWDWYPPAVVDMTAMTHFVFGRYGPGGGTLGGLPGQFLEGAGAAHDPLIEDALITKAHLNGVKAIAMGGGAGDGAGWVASTATLGVRTTFIANILDTCVAKNYDGVDIDWEDSLDTPTQQNQLMALLTELRAAAAARPRYQAPNAPFLITFPTLALNINIDLPVPAWKVTVASLVDQFNIMTYDMRFDCCGWETWLWAALKGATATTPMSVESSIQGFVDAGVPRTKLGFGLGFYGGGYGPPVSGPLQAIAGYWGGNDNVHNYRDFYAQNMFAGADVTYVFDAAAQAGYYRYSPPRVYQGNSVSVLVTEDSQSIAAKGAWSRAGNASGVIIWSINYGYIAALGSNPPLEAVKQAFLPGVTCPTVAKGDFNSDSKVDLLFRNQTSNRNMAWLMNGIARSTASWISPDPAAGQQIVGADDFNADSQSDLLFWNSTTGLLDFWLMNGTTRVGAGVPIGGASTLALNWKLAATGDFNHDSKPDLLWRNSVSQKLAIWTMNGTTKAGNLTPSPGQAVNPNWEVVAALDYDNDGNRDLLWYNSTSGRLVMWFMDGSVVRINGVFTNPAMAGDFTWKVLAGGDYGLGVAGTNCSNDVVWRNSVSGNEVVWYMDFAATRTGGVFTIPNSPTADPDGNPTAPTDWLVVGPR